MACSRQREDQIVHLVAGELSLPQAWLLRQHLRACTACVTEWRRTQTLRSELQAVAAHRPTAALDQAIRRKLVEAEGRQSSPQPAPTRRSATRGRRFALSAIAVSLGTLLLTLPWWGPAQNVAASDVRAALGQVNTWHATGWKRINGQEVPWEVWGQRSPRLYHVRVGNQVRVDDGTQRFEVIPGSAPGTGVVLQMRTRPQLDDWTIHPDRLFQASLSARERPWHETWRTVVFGTQLDQRAVLFTVDKKAHLPIRYEVREGMGAEGTVLEQLRLEYGEALPSSVRSSQWPKGFQVLDLLRSAPAAGIPKEYLAYRGGLAAQAIPLGPDANGRILVRVRGWMDQLRLGRGAPFLMWVSEPANTPGEVAAPATCRDERGRAYVQVPMESLRNLQHLTLGGDRVLLFAPVEPPAPRAALPRKLSLSLRIAASPSPTLTHTRYFDTVSFEEKLTWTLALPATTTSLDYTAQLGPGWREKAAAMGVAGESEAAATCRARAHHYLRGLDVERLVELGERPGIPLTSRTWRTRLTRAAYWLETAIGSLKNSQVTDRNQREAAETRLEWAWVLKQLGQPRRAEQVLAPVLQGGVKARIYGRPGDEYRRRARTLLKLPITHKPAKIGE